MLKNDLNVTGSGGNCFQINVIVWRKNPTAIPDVWSWGKQIRRREVYWSHLWITGECDDNLRTQEETIRRQRGIFIHTDRWETKYCKCHDMVLLVRVFHHIFQTLIVLCKINWFPVVQFLGIVGLPAYWSHLSVPLSLQSADLCVRGGK